MKNIFVLCCALALFSCEGKFNNRVLTKAEMVPLLVDLSIASELVGKAKLSRSKASLYFKSVYKVDVLNRYDVDVTKFDDSFRYYSSRPEDFVWIQTAVADSLKVKHLRGEIDF